MDNEITINGVTYVRKDTIAKDKGKYVFKIAKDKGKYVFKSGCRYYTFYSCDPDKCMEEIQEIFPKKNVFFVGKKGYCGKVCLEVDIKDITVDFLEKLLYVSRSFFNIIDNKEKFRDMVKVEMSRPTRQAIPL